MFRFDAPQPLFHDIVAKHGQWLGNKEALIFEDQRVSWQTFSTDVERTAAALQSLGLKQEERIAVAMSNSAATVVSLFGIMAAGCVSVPINLTMNDEALTAMINDADAACIVVTEDQQSRIDKIRETLRSDLQLVTTGPSLDRWLNLDELLSQSVNPPERPQINGQSTLNIIYSSGTTGQPKGIVHTHEGRLDWARDLALTLRYHYGARTLITIGLYSNISWVAMLCTLLIGGTLVVRQRFDAADSLDAIERHHVTHLSMVPIQYQRLHEVQLAQPRDLSSVQAPMSCGSPLQPDLKSALFDLFPGDIIELYGLTEGIITTLQPEDAEGRWSSVGKPLVGTDIRIIDDEGDELPVGEAGEIVSRGRITMPAYLNREEASREAAWVDEQGQMWLRSGDIGRLDEERFLYVVDRKKDMILSGGQNIYPQDIEAVLQQHEGIDDVAVIPATSERWGESPVALVVLKDATLEPRDIVDWCNARVGRHQRLVDAILIDELPRNPNGKILKKNLRQQFDSLKYS